MSKTPRANWSRALGRAVGLGGALATLGAAEASAAPKPANAIIPWKAESFTAPFDFYASRGVAGGRSQTGTWFMISATTKDGESFQLMRRFDRGQTAANFLASKQPAD